MTVQTTSSKAGPFFGNGSTLVWNSGFRIDQAADLHVIYTDPDGTDSQLDGTLYTATGFGDDDGVSVTYPITGSPIGAAEKITLLRVVSYNQQTSITNQGGFYPQVIERALDRIVYQTQQIAEKLGRAITLSASSALSGLFLPDPESGKFLRGRADGTGYENADVTGGGSIGIPVTVANGGTNATTATAARANLGLVTTTDVGAVAGAIAALDANARLGTLDGRALINVPSLGMKNRIINGRMDLAQRGSNFTSLTGSPGNPLLDRFAYNATSTAVATVSQATDVPASLEFQSSLKYTITTADASIAAGDFAILQQRIEGLNVRDLIGNTFTLSFWVKSAKAGIHCVAFRNVDVGGSDRSYVLEYTIAAANTWQKVSLTVTVGLITAGTWNWTNGIGLSVAWVLAGGTILQTAAGAWQTGNFVATANQVNLLDTIGNQFVLTGVQLEVGRVATQFEHRPFATELLLCQRYYEKNFQQGVVPAQNVGARYTIFPQVAGASVSQFVGPFLFKVTKRTTPSLVFYNPLAPNTQMQSTSATDWTATTLVTNSDTGFLMSGTSPAGSVAGTTGVSLNWSADAEI